VAVVSDAESERPKKTPKSGPEDAEIERRLTEAGVLEAVREVAARHNVTMEDIYGKHRPINVLRARWEAWRVARDTLGIGPRQVAELFMRAKQSIVEGLESLEKVLAEAPSQASLETRMRPGVGERLDDECANGGDCLIEFGKHHPNAGACHCPTGCPFYEGVPREASYPGLCGIDTDPGLA
jgi:hypothetical protein